MRFMRPSHCFGLLAVLPVAACGSKSSNKPDASVPADSATPADAMLDAAPTPAGCDFGEQNDQGNDDSNTGTAEATGLTFTTSTVICGNVDSGHFASNVVDIDSYTFTTAADGDVLISITSPGGATLVDFEVDLFDDQGGEITSGIFFGDHGILSATIPAGDYEVSMLAANATDVTAAIPYKIKIATDVALTRCPNVTAAASYTEKLDTVANNQAGNDIVNVSFTQTGESLVLTTATTDNPEPTALTIAPATNVRITGTATLPTGTSADDYLERDTYLVKTGASTNQLAVRLDWPGSTEDFDLFVFPEITNTTDTPFALAQSDQISTTAGEFATFSVKPSSNYWIWVAPFNTDTTSGPALPLTYDVSVCGETFP